LSRIVAIPLIHLIFGTMKALAAALGRSKVGWRVNVSFLERYHATDRHKNAREVKTYTFSKDWRVHASMTYFTIYSYNFCWPVRTLRYRDERGRVRARSPAMAAGLADHVGTMREWITLPTLQCASDTIKNSAQNFVACERLDGQRYADRPAREGPGGQLTFRLIIQPAVASVLRFGLDYTMHG
jgi:hypothetical protein